MTEQDFMRRAIAISAEMMRALKGGPFGAVVVKDGEIIAEGHNRVTSSNDPGRYYFVDDGASVSRLPSRGSRPLVSAALARA